MYHQNYKKKTFYEFVLNLSRILEETFLRFKLWARFCPNFDISIREDIEPVYHLLSDCTVLTTSSSDDVYGLGNYEFTMKS